MLIGLYVYYCSDIILMDAYYKLLGGLRVSLDLDGDIEEAIVDARFVNSKDNLLFY